MDKNQALTLTKQALTELESALQEGRSEAMTRYLDVMARFPRYSLRNMLLILQQRPDATHVAGFHTWKQLGRWVRKGEQGIGILAPLVRRNRELPQRDERTEKSGGEEDELFGFRVVHVFDVTQTEGQPLPEPAPIDGEPGELLDRLREMVRGYSIKLSYATLAPGVQGGSSSGYIAIQKELPPAVDFAVLVHEVAHELMHQGANHDAGRSKSVCETEAEAVAYVVCRACGIDTTQNSADYIQLYRGTTATLNDSLTRIQATAAELIGKLAPPDSRRIPPSKHLAA